MLHGHDVWSTFFSDRHGGPLVKVRTSGEGDLGKVKTATRKKKKEKGKTEKASQMPGDSVSVLGRKGVLSVCHGWTKEQFWSAAYISVWRHVTFFKINDQICFWYTFVTGLLSREEKKKTALLKKKKRKIEERTISTGICHFISFHFISF